MQPNSYYCVSSVFNLDAEKMDQTREAGIQAEILTHANSSGEITGRTDHPRPA